MTLLHFVHKMHTRITSKLVPAVSCFSIVPIQNKSTLNHNCTQKCTKSRVTRFYIPTRTFWESFPDLRRNALFEKDGVDKERYDLIYRSGMFHYAFYAQLVSEVVIAFQLVCGIGLVINSLVGTKIALFGSSAVPVIFDAVGFGIFSYFTIQTAFLYTLAQRTVLRIYYSEEDEEYIVIFMNAISPFVTEQFRCKPGDLLCYPKTLVSTLCGGYRVKEKRVILNHHYFKNIFHYNHLLGFVK